MATDLESGKKPPAQEATKPTVETPSATTPENAALLALESGDAAAAMAEAEAAAAEAHKQNEAIAATTPEDLEFDPMIAQEIQKELAAEEAELAGAREEFSAELGGASWRKQTEATKAREAKDEEAGGEGGKEAQEAVIVQHTRVEVLGERSGGELAKTKAPEEWEALSEKAGGDLKGAEQRVDKAHKAIKDFESGRDVNNLSALENLYLAYARTELAEAEVSKQNKELDQERFRSFAEIAKAEQQQKELDEKAKQKKREAEDINERVKTNNKVIDHENRWLDEARKKQESGLPWSEDDEKMRTIAQHSIQEYTAKNEALRPVAERLDLEERALASQKTEGENLLQQMKNHVTELDDNISKTELALLTLTAERERSQTEYVNAYAKQQEEATATAQEEPAAGQEESVVLGEKGMRAPPGWREVEDQKKAAEKAAKDAKKKSGGVMAGVGVLGILGVKRAVSGALDFTDTMLGHAISFIKSPGQFLNKFKSEHDSRTKRLGAFRGTASTISWALFGGPEEAIEQRITPEERKRQEQAQEEKKRQVSA